MRRREVSFRIGRVSGVEILIHPSWLIIAGLVVLGFWGWLTETHPQLSDNAALFLSVVGTAVLFGSVLIHELSHAVVAKARGIEVKGITLYLFGGATEADASSKNAADEFMIAVVGPLTSLATAAVLAVVAITVGSPDDPVPDLAGYLAQMNVLLALFNLAPGLPLDGGRVFRSIVWAITGDFRRATRWAAGAGEVFGYLLISVGVVWLFQGALGGLWLAAIGWMISQSAHQSEQQDALREFFKDLAAEDVMTSPVLAIPSEMSATGAVRNYFAKEDRTTFPVLEGSNVVGMLSLTAVRRLSRAERDMTTAGQLAVGEDPAMVATPLTPMSEIAEALSTGAPKARVLVMDDGVLVGIISPRDILRRSSLAPLLGDGSA